VTYQSSAFALSAGLSGINAEKDDDKTGQIADKNNLEL
jgi:hypothetical protein